MCTILYTHISVAGEDSDSLTHSDIEREGEGEVEAESPQSDSSAVFPTLPNTAHAALSTTASPRPTLFPSVSPPSSLSPPSEDAQRERERESVELYQEGPGEGIKHKTLAERERERGRVPQEGDGGSRLFSMFAQLHRFERSFVTTLLPLLLLCAFLTPFVGLFVLWAQL
ncbi:hypothetical protein KIPB_014877, partial [Kipferlia bialata]|eukprot:g14877.t1